MSGGEDIHPPPEHERRVSIHLTEDQLDDIANRAVEKAFDKIYEQVGRSVVRKITWAVGLIVTGLMLWIVGTGGAPK